MLAPRVGGMTVLCTALLLCPAATRASATAVRSDMPRPVSAELEPPVIGETAGSLAADPDAIAAIEARYVSLGGAEGVLGGASDDVHDVAGGAARTFVEGSIYWSPARGAYAAYGDIERRYRVLGGPALLWGLPISDEADGEVAGTRESAFVNGLIVWSRDTGAHGVRGPVLERWSALGAARSGLGLPTGSTETVGNGLRGFFQRGEIHWSPATGARRVYGGMLEEFGRLGGPQGAGFPMDEETAVPAGVGQVFERARIYWSGPTGAHALFGDVLGRYLALGGPASTLGLPLTGELAVPGGLRAMATGGQILWSASHGAKALQGDIHRRYESVAGPWSVLGLPTTEEYDVAEGRRVDFTGGAIVWIRATGATRLISPFRAAVHTLGPGDLPYSYRSGCPVGPASLRRLEVSYVDYAGNPAVGNVIVHRDAAPVLARVFDRAFAAGFPIQRMVSVDAYRGNDVASMAAGNTSAFNCRKVVGNPYRISQHSYGNAIDINPAQNPYVASGVVYPSGSGTYLDRRNHRQGMHVNGTAVLETMRAEGWSWGARWSEPDYHHFSSNGG